MTARLAIKLIQEEELIENYIDKGYSIKIIAKKLHKDVRFVDLIVKHIALKKKNSKLINDKTLENFSVKHNLDKDQLLSFYL